MIRTLDHVPLNGTTLSSAHLDQLGYPDRFDQSLSSYSWNFNFQHNLSAGNWWPPLPCPLCIMYNSPFCDEIVWTWAPSGLFLFHLFFHFISKIRWGCLSPYESSTLSYISPAQSVRALEWFHRISEVGQQKHFFIWKEWNEKKRWN